MGFIVSINVGLPTQVNLPGKPRFRSAIFKKPVKRKVFLDYLGFEGDGVADLVDHGGADKAISVYVKNHYAFWENEFSKKLSPGAFGERIINGFEPVKIEKENPKHGIISFSLRENHFRTVAQKNPVGQTG